MSSLINKIDRLTTRSNELSNRQVTANASGFFNPSGSRNSIRLRETYPIQWTNLTTTGAPKAIPLTLSSWYANSAATPPVNLVIANLGGVSQWLLTQGSLYNEYRFVSDPILHWVPAGGTQQTGQISFGQLRDPNDLFRGPSTNVGPPVSYDILRSNANTAITAIDVLTMENSYAGPVSLPFSHRFPLNNKRRLETWMRQDSSLLATRIVTSSTGPVSQPQANLRLDSPFGAIAIQCDVDIFSVSTLGRMFIEYDLEFRSRVVPTLQSSFGSPTALSVIPIPLPELLSGKTYIGILPDSQRELGQKSYKRSTQTVDPISRCKLLALNQLLVNFDLDRIQGKVPSIRIISDVELKVTPRNCTLSLPRMEESNSQFTWHFELIPLSGDNVGVEITSQTQWSGELSWYVSD